MPFRFVAGFDPVWIVYDGKNKVDDFCEKKDMHQKYKGYLCFLTPIKTYQQ